MSESLNLTSISPVLEAESSREGLGGLVGLLNGQAVAFPLRVVTVRASLVENVAYTTVTQEFSNPLKTPVEAVHIFPLPEDGAVLGMKLVSGDLRVTAECRTREQAEAEFDAARLEGFEAGLLTAESGNVHTLRVTNLPPGGSVRVALEIIQTLPSEDGHQTWRFPTVMAPRYLPGEPIGHSGPGVYPDTDRVPDASRLQPPLRLEGGTELDLEVKIEGRVRSLRSSLHAICLDLEDGAGVRVAPAAKATLDRDFILSYALDRPDTGGLRAWTDGKVTLLGIEPPDDVDAPVLPRETVLVIDTSGSMAGDKLASAKVALKTVLHGLREGDRFRLIEFNSLPRGHSDELLDYDQASLDQADAWINARQATGGTEMLSAIQMALAGRPDKGRVRTVVFITDGQALNEDELVAAVYHRRAEARFFTLGIDTAVNGSLLKRLARAGGGTCTLVTPGEDLRSAIAGLESRIGLPLAEGLSVSTGEPADPALSPLFAGQTAVVLLKGSPRSLTVRARGPAGVFKASARPKRIDFDLAPLWAQARIRSLEARWAAYPSEREGLRGEIQALALEYGLASRFTALVAIQHQVRSDGRPIEIVQPVELPDAWSRQFLEPMDIFNLPAAPRGRHKMMVAGSLHERLSLPASLAVSDGRASSGIKAEPRKGRNQATKDSEALEALLLEQRADGSWEGDASSTAAALACLVLAGHTRKAGSHRQAVRKAVACLKGLETLPEVEAALKALKWAEAHAGIDVLPRELRRQLEPLTRVGAAGKLLRRLLKRLGSPARAVER